MVYRPKRPVRIGKEKNREEKGAWRCLPDRSPGHDRGWWKEYLPARFAGHGDGPDHDLAWAGRDIGRKDIACLPGMVIVTGKILKIRPLPPRAATSATVRSAAPDFLP
jgi:hypothetical protein